MQKRALNGFLSALLALFTLNSTTAGVFTGQDLNEPFEVHGRLGCYVGSPPFRIWIVGSNRILGVSDRPRSEAELPAMPQRLLDIFKDRKGWLSIKMYGDFLVKPLKPDIKGHMRPVQVLRVRNLVVTVNGEVVIDERM